MDTTRLRYFSAVARLGSVTAAAQELNVTVAAVSKSVRALSDELGYDLVVPHGRGLLVTDHGRLVAERADRLLADVEALYDPEVLSSRASDHFRLGAYGWFASGFYGELMEHHIPHCDVTLYDTAPEQLEHAVAKNEIDVMITTRPTGRPDLTYECVGRMPYAVFARRRLLDRCDPRELPFAVQGMADPGGDGSSTSDFWPSRPNQRVVKYPVGSVNSVFELCRRGLAAAHMPVFVAAIHNRDVQARRRLVHVEHPGIRRSPTMVDVFVARRTSNPDPHFVEKVAGPLASVCCNLEL